MKRLRNLLMAFAFVSLFSACKEDEPPLPDNLVQFESEQMGFPSDLTEATVKLKLSRHTDVAIPVTVNLVASGLSYGSEFATEPAATNNSLVLSIPAGSTGTSFKIIKANGVLLDGDEILTLEIKSVSNPVLIGTKPQLTVSFSEILATGAVVEVDGGGPTYPNKVFIDLSANRQTAVNRINWDFGFAGGSDFKVIMNSSNAMAAFPLNKNDIDQVTEQEINNLGAKTHAVVGFTATDQSVNYIDDPNGDLNKTAIATVSATASENKVYVVNMGQGVGSPAPARGWKKIRVLRNTNGGYTLQYADLNATTHQEIQIAKDAAYNFRYASLTTNNVIEVEPQKARWDIAWTGFTGKTNAGTYFIPYYFQDMILLNNAGGVQAAKVATSTLTYEAFAESNLTGITFSSDPLTIGADWRRTSPAPAQVYDDRFYLVKDAVGNIYKLKFTALTTNGERGKPQLIYALVKKG